MSSSEKNGSLNKAVFYEAIDNVSDIVLLLDMSGTVRFVNEAVRHAIGYDPEELTGKSCFDFIHPDDVKSVKDSIADAAENGFFESPENRVINKNGSYKVFETQGKSVLDEHGRVAGIALVSRDITKRKFHEKQLRMLSESLLMFGSDPHENIEKILGNALEILHADRAEYCAFETGGMMNCFAVYSQSHDSGLAPVYTRDSVMLADIEGFPSCSFELSGDSADATPAELNIFLESGFQSGVIETIGISPSRRCTLGAYRSSLHPFSEEDRKIASMLARAISIEIDRLEYEQMLKEFIHVVSHEIRHPIAILKGYSDLLTQQRSDFEKGEMIEIVDSMGKAAVRLEILMNDLFDSSQIDRGKMLILKTKVDISDLLERVVQEEKARGSRREIVISLPKRRKTVRADSIKLARVLVILVDNAMKHSPDNEPVEISVEAADKGVVFSVKNSGEPLAENLIERIFDKNFQEQLEGSEKKSGLGLGLYIAKGIVKAHEGNIWYEVDDENKSVFSFSIP